ncbi:hypothetical protein D0T25_24680 [Duganella sp. BJB488]|uniref:hypothetical protein n=1 Tax=unclassified Duganella TaxID=2636909 RepID=UPI000E347024|nr:MULTISPECIES: hypothetical protein [unclassified Duganella]RFP12437.1 hypothetical protein D0T26_24475 [Duganella sp. BJB489]RFP16471.1 hypothetical protein D0T25_24680 [Duganella sp. BJB488]RFP30801.1 hypothetical protein D0T24_25820 [Duganella sp. BJB480]
MRLPRLILIPVLALAGAAAHADGLADLKAALEHLQEPVPLKATLDSNVWRRNGEGKDADETSGQAAVGIEDGQRGMQLSYSRDMLARLDAEATAVARNPNAKTPTLNAAREFSPTDLRPMISAASSLTQMLEKTSFLTEKADVYQGKPARMLTFAQGIDVLADRDRKYVKEFDGRLHVWIAADGTPLASRITQSMHGRAFIVITFEAKNEESSVYALAGNRLVSIRKESRNTASGAGEKSEFKIVKTLQLQ